MTNTAQPPETVTIGGKTYTVEIEPGARLASLTGPRGGKWGTVENIRSGLWPVFDSRGRNMRTAGLRGPVRLRRADGRFEVANEMARPGPE